MSSLRNGVYYWKCDSPQSAEEKLDSFFKEKYDRSDLTTIVSDAVRQCFGSAPDMVEPVRADGNHYAFVVGLKGTRYFFRADDGRGEDDYLLAESRVMNLAAEQGVPVPKVYFTDVDRIQCPFRFQILEHCTEPNLNKWQRDGSLNSEKVSRQLGELLRKVHSVPMEGFGFVDTVQLRKTGKVTGLNRNYPAYFETCLDEHLGYLRQHGLLDSSEIDEIAQLFGAHRSRMDCRQGVLVHRDPALWNLLGTPDRITAIIDWDDAVSGDPADDLGILQCFHDDAYMAGVMDGYWAGERPGDDFLCRVWLHNLRNMLWKAKIRHSLGYFEKGNDFFLNAAGSGESLREVTLGKIRNAVRKLKGFDTP